MAQSSGNNSSSSNNSNSNNNPAALPVSEVYWGLVDKADKKFARVRDLPSYGRSKYDSYFHKVFKVYTKLWKFQQENRQKLVEAGLKRWEIGEIASRIAQLYYSQYQRTSEASYLSESYIFYEAILSREYFKDSGQEIALANKQLRCYARFIIVCLMLNRREMVQHLLSQLRMLVDDYRRTFQETDAKEWKRVVQEIIRFMKADSTFSNSRPLRYSARLDPHPNSIPRVASLESRQALKLRDAILTSYHHNEIKFAEVTLDTFRMLQCLEWEPSGIFYQVRTGDSGINGSFAVQTGSSRMIPAEDITDPTLPPNPRKAILYRPSVTHFLAVLATICEELPTDSAVLLYISASGKPTRGSASLSTSGTILNHAVAESRADHHVTDTSSEATSVSPLSSPHDSPTPQRPSIHESGKLSNVGSGGLWLSSQGSRGLNCMYPGDIIPFTRKPLFVIIDSDNSNVFKVISGAERGEPAALLLSPAAQPNCVNTSKMDCSRYQNNGSLFTFFLTAPLPAFCRLVGVSAVNLGTGAYEQAEKLLSSFLSEWGGILAVSSSLDFVWARVLSDPFFRRLILRFIFCRACLSLYSSSCNKKECIPECLPRLPDQFLPSSSTIESCIFHLASSLQVVEHFTFSESISISKDTAAKRQQDGDYSSSESNKFQTSDMTSNSGEIEEHFDEENGH